jgi:hypothetical protein
MEQGFVACSGNRISAFNRNLGGLRLYWLNMGVALLYAVIER